MITLKVEKRNPEVKAKKLRRERFRLRCPLRKRNEGVYSIQLTEPEAPPLYQSQQRRYSGNA